MLKSFPFILKTDKSLKLVLIFLWNLVRARRINQYKQYPYYYNQYIVISDIINSISWRKVTLPVNKIAHMPFGDSPHVITESKDQYCSPELAVSSGR